MRSLYDVVCHPGARWFALVVLALSFVLPVGGIGVDLCWFKAVTHLPCPGCGLTRSITSLSHGDLAGALHYHPFGPSLYAGAWGLVLLHVGGAPAQGRVRAWFSRWEAPLRTLYLSGVYAFVAFGVTRLAAALLWPGSVPLV